MSWTNIECLWWEGVVLWYNDQDYMRAIEVWQEAVKMEQISDEEITVSNRVASTMTPPRLLSLLTAMTKRPGKRVRTENKSIQVAERSSIVMLELFLAGCYLDAERWEACQSMLFDCLSLCLSGAKTDDHAYRHHDNIFHRCVLELLACFEEDPKYADCYWRLQQTVVQFFVDFFAAEFSMASSHNFDARMLFKNKFQRPGYMHPTLSVSEPPESVGCGVYPDSHSSYPKWCRDLEKHWMAIKGEFEQLYWESKGDGMDSTYTSTPLHWPKVGAGEHREGAGARDSRVVAGTDAQHSGDWREIVLFGAGAQPDLAPRTSQLVQELAPDAVSLAGAGGGEVIFSVLAPHTHVKPHCGSTNLRWTAHLGLHIPCDSNQAKSDKPSCAIRVADTWCCWQEGKTLVFDDSFEHEVVNSTSEIRALLLLRFWHPMLSTCDRAMALDGAIKYNEHDRLRRYNPPLPGLPSDRTVAGVNRGMEKTKCPFCGMTGYQSIRVVEQPTNSTFRCECGHPIL